MPTDNPNTLATLSGPPALTDADLVPNIAGLNLGTAPTVTPRLANGRDYLNNPQMQSNLEDLYRKAMPSFNDKYATNEHLYAIDKDNNISVRSMTAQGQKRAADATVPADSQMLIHSHPATAEANPSPGDYVTATKLGRPNFVVSRDAIYVAMPGTDPTQRRTLRSRTSRRARAGS